MTPSNPADSRAELMKKLAEQLATIPRPAGSPPLRAEQFLAYLNQQSSTAAAARTPGSPPDAMHNATVEAALLSVIEAFGEVLSGLRNQPAPSDGDAETPDR